MTKEIYFTLLGWEPRFLLGTEKNLRSSKPDEIVLFFYHEYLEFTKESLATIEKMCNEHKISLKKAKLRLSEPLENWRAIQTIFGQICNSLSEIFLDITTMPREIIWNILHFSKNEHLTVKYSYYVPEKYESWSTRDPGVPRLIYKHSGVTDLDKNTALVVVTGFDLERSKQFLDFFNPEKAIFVMPEGAQFNNSEYNHNRHKPLLTRKGVEAVPISDCYNTSALNDLFCKIIEKLTEYNVVLSSLGPKLTALEIFKVQLKYDNTALCYIPSKEYNIDYSKGIGSCYSGVIDFSNMN